MIFKNPEYQRKHDEIARKLKELNGTDLDEEMNKWRKSGYPKLEQNIESKKAFEEWRDNPRRDEIERNNKMMVESLREIHGNIGKNIAEQESRRKKSSKPKLKKKIKRCKCK